MGWRGRIGVGWERKQEWEVMGREGEKAGERGGKWNWRKKSSKGKGSGEKRER